MLSSGIIDLAIGMAFIFGVTAALASVITEMIARFLGLRGAYLLLGLRELVDNAGTSVALSGAINDWKKAQNLITGDESEVTSRNPQPQTAERTAAPTGGPSSVTAALLGSPILSSQGMTGKINNRSLTLDGKKVLAVPKAKGTTPAAPETSGAQKGRIRAGWHKVVNSAPVRKIIDSAPVQKVIYPFRTWSQRRSLPSYISSRSFAEAIIDLLVPDKTGETGMTVIQGRIKTMTEEMPKQMGTLGDSLNSLAANANGDLDRFRTSIENWYDDHMARVSGWYKRRTTWITFGIGLVLVVLLNINALTIGHALYGDSAARTAVSSLAAQGNPCPATDKDQQKCLEALESRVSAAAQAGLPIGWATVQACAKQGVQCDWWARRGITNHDGGSAWQVILVLIGFVITIVALAPGAQFWFGLVVKLNSLRSTGPPPATSGTAAQ